MECPSFAATLEVDDLVGMMDSEALHQHKLVGEFSRLTDRGLSSQAAENKDKRERARHAGQEAEGAHAAPCAVHVMAHICAPKSDLYRLIPMVYDPDHMNVTASVSSAPRKST